MTHMLQADKGNQPSKAHETLSPLRVRYRLYELYKRFQGSVGGGDGDT